MRRVLEHRGGGGSAVRSGWQRLVASPGRRELALFAAIYLLYDGARWAFHAHLRTARAHAHWIIHLERSLHVAVEGQVRRALDAGVASFLLANVYLAAQLVVLAAAAMRAITHVTRIRIRGHPRRHRARAPPRFSHRMLAQEPIKAAGGQVRITDSSNFPAATTIAAALVEVEPGAIRELHWHPNTDEWQYYIAGQGRMTVFASGAKARTFDYQAGDVGYVPFAMGHYVENTGDETLVFLEMFRSDHFADISLSQWMALTPPALVRAHLNLDEATIAALSRDKPIIVR